MVGVEVEGTRVLPLGVESAICAYLDRCPHGASRLSYGDLECGTITCTRTQSGRSRTASPVRRTKTAVMATPTAARTRAVA
jgi:hypothetical protein